MVALVATWILVMMGCWLSFEVLKRSRYTRFLFGIKPLVTPRDPEKTPKVLRS